MAIRIALIDDHAPLREAMRENLALEPDFEIVAEAANGRGAIDIAARLQPDVMLLDIVLPDLSGIEVMKQLRADHPAIRVVALSIYVEKHFVTEMLKAGAQGYVAKIDGNDVPQAIRSVVCGDIYLSREIAAALR